MIEPHPSVVNILGGQRQARLAAQLLRAPVALVWQRAAGQLHLVGSYGLSNRELRQPDGLVASLARRLRHGPNIPADDSEPVAGFAALAVAPRGRAGAPLRVIYCVADRAPRAWSADELVALDDLVAMGAAELRLAALTSARARAERFELVRRQSLEALLADRPIDEVLNLLARGIEGQLDGAHCAVMLLDAAGQRLHTAAAPSIDPAFTTAIEGVRIGPMVGSCGTAAYLNTAVIVADISTDPRWERWRDPALTAGLHACWSLPVRSADGRVLGTFALYYGAPRSPTRDELHLVEGAAHIVALAFERSQTQAALQASEANLRRSEANIAALLNHAKEAIWSLDRDGRVITLNRQAAELFQQARGQALLPGVRFLELLDAAEQREWEHMFAQALGGE